MQFSLKSNNNKKSAYQPPIFNRILKHGTGWLWNTQGDFEADGRRFFLFLSVWTDGQGDAMCVKGHKGALNPSKAFLA